MHFNCNWILAPLVAVCYTLVKKKNVRDWEFIGVM